MSEPGTGLSAEDQAYLLQLARQSIEAAANGFAPPDIDVAVLSPPLRKSQACFVTLHQADQLRGCTGVLVGRAPLAIEVLNTAAMTALRDPRFPPVSPDEVETLVIEISVLTQPQRLDVPSPVDLPTLIRPHIDGVTLIYGSYRATFLPQVWEKAPEPPHFLDMLCEKMGLPRRAWVYTRMEVEVYQVEIFSEP